MMNILQDVSLALGKTITLKYQQAYSIYTQIGGRHDYE